jgi:hypothetical protein
MMNKIDETAVGLTRTKGARAATAALALAAGMLAGTPGHAAIALDPLLAGQYAAGSGANAVFHRIDSAWTGTSVYWKEPPASGAPGTYSNTAGDGFTRIGDHSWGTGLWGLADWRAINAPGSALPLQSWSGVLATIDQGDALYASNPFGAALWGAAGPLPFTGSDDVQNNWTAHYTGYLRISDPGAYNFGVLYDDGFFLRIWGADASPLEISSDFLSPRDRLGFDQDLLLGTGLYRFELGAYDRIEAGVVNLAWKQGSGGWQTVPTEHLVRDPIAISAPGTAAVLIAGLGAFTAFRRRKRT